MAFSDRQSDENLNTGSHVFFSQGRKNFNSSSMKARYPSSVGLIYPWRITYYCCQNVEKWLNRNQLDSSGGFNDTVGIALSGRQNDEKSHESNFQASKR